MRTNAGSYGVGRFRCGVVFNAQARSNDSIRLQLRNLAFGHLQDATQYLVGMLSKHRWRMLEFQLRAGESHWARHTGEPTRNRMIELGASFVCSVESTRCPVSDACTAICAVSRSRISPTMMMSGS